MVPVGRSSSLVVDPANPILTIIERAGFTVQSWASVPSRRDDRCGTIDGNNFTPLAAAVAAAAAVLPKQWCS